VARFEDAQVHRHENRQGDEIDQEAAVPAPGRHGGDEQEHQRLEQRADQALQHQPGAALAIFPIVRDQSVHDGQDARFAYASSRREAKITSRFSRKNGNVPTMP
jgi:hypothetical protein